MNTVHELQLDGHTISVHTDVEGALAAAESYGRTWGREGLDIKTSTPE